MLDVIFALGEWRCYLHGAKFTIVTDNRPHTYLDETTNSHALRRRARWLAESADYTYEWMYKPGTGLVAVPISRAPQLFSLIPTPTRTIREDVTPEGGTDDDSAENSELQQYPTGTEAKVLEHYIIDGFDTRRREAYDKEARETLLNLQRQGNGLYWTVGTQLFVPEWEEVSATTSISSLRNDCIEAVHAHPSSGHCGDQITLSKLQEVFYWPNMRKDVVKHIHH